MGEVYRARDTSLHRDVALKVLPETGRADEDRVARFRREAQLLASLNHVHIAAIYGLEESGPVQALVLELVEGPTLADRIAQGPVPIDEALPMAKQIAEALEAAHEQGIIHRDLKPANIKVRADGTVKVLDFGLAKVFDAAASGDGHDVPASNSLAITSPAQSQVGAILGTAAYMSPEQARGKGVDRRADLWAFGCVLFEMLTGKPAFAGETFTDVVAAVVKNEPDWDALPPETGAPVRSLLRRCLQKDPTRRLQHAGDARVEIEEALAAPGPLAATPRASTRARQLVHLAPWTIAIAALALYGAQLRRSTADTATPPVVRLELNMPHGVEVGHANSPSISFSRDGTQLAVVGTAGGIRRVYLRRFDDFEMKPVPGTDGASVCTFSPDGRSVAFVGGDRVLRTVSVADGLVTTVVNNVNYAGGFVWGADGYLTFVRQDGLWRVAAEGGAPEQLTTLDSAQQERLHAWPAAVADGRAILFTVVTDHDRTATHIDAVSTATKQRRRVLTNARTPMYTSSGHLLFFREQALVAAPFDAASLEVLGSHVAVLQNVAFDQLGSPSVAVSASGSLAYVSAANATRRVVWVTRSGLEQSISDAVRAYQNPRLSPDGQRIVVEVTGGELWMHDVARGTFTVLTSGTTLGNTFAVWTPDGKHVAFRTINGFHVVSTDGSGEDRLLPNTTAADIPTSISPEGKLIAFIRPGADTSGDIVTMPLDGTGEPRPLVVTRGYDGGGQFSPDGRWFAFVSNESGRFEVFIRPYPGPEGRVQVSTDGGTHPKWSANGLELFYRFGEKMMVVDVSTAPGLTLSRPRVLFEQRYAFGAAQTIPNYDVTHDGQRFVMIKDESSAGRLNVVLNWLDELKRLAPLPTR
jgi:Tol biopolymer transport system component